MLRLSSVVVLAALLALVLAALIGGDGGLRQTRRLRAQLAELHAKNVERERVNAQLQAEVDDLRHGSEMVEERARAELGMIRKDEIFVQYARR